MENTEQSKLNPWISIWTEPRFTIQQIVDSDPTRLVLILAALGGVADALTKQRVLAFSDAVIFAVLSLAGAAAGLLSLYLGAYLLRWTGNWLGGTGSLVTIRAASAWCSIPKILSAILLIALWVPFGTGLVRTPVAGMETAIMLMMTTLGCWGLVLFCKCLGEVQGFSAWKGLANSILALLAFLVPIAVIAVLYGVLKDM